MRSSGEGRSDEAVGAASMLGLKLNSSTSAWLRANGSKARCAWEVEDAIFREDSGKKESTVAQTSESDVIAEKIASGSSAICT